MIERLKLNQQWESNGFSIINQQSPIINPYSEHGYAKSVAR